MNKFLVSQAYEWTLTKLASFLLGRKNKANISGSSAAPPQAGQQEAAARVVTKYTIRASTIVDLVVFLLRWREDRREKIDML